MRTIACISPISLFQLQRKKGEFDDEAMGITERLLGANPDFYTLWNYRKKILSKFKEKR